MFHRLQKGLNCLLAINCELLVRVEAPVSLYFQNMRMQARSLRSNSCSRLYRLYLSPHICQSQSKWLASQIYKHKLYGKKYGWVVHTPDSKGWWKRTYSQLDCSADQVNEAAEYAIAIDHLYLSKTNVSTVSGLVSKFKEQNWFIFRKSVRNLNQRKLKRFFSENLTPALFVFPMNKRTNEWMNE